MSDNPAVEAATPAVMPDEQADASKVEEPVSASKAEDAVVEPPKVDDNGAKVAVPEERPVENGEEKEEKAANGESDGRDSKDVQPRKPERNGHSHSGRDRKEYKHKPRNAEFDDLPESDDPAEIRAQVEFYFSDSNLGTDKHLFFETQGPKNLPVSLKHLSTFRRMRHFQPYSAIVAALRHSDFVVVVDDGNFSGAGNEGVHRQKAIEVAAFEADEKNPPSMTALYERALKKAINKFETSVYVKGFGVDAEGTDQLSLENFFKPYGSTMVRKRRNEDRDWKGSVFVEFGTEDEQQQFLALDPKPRFQGEELSIMSKREYSETKCKEKGIIPNWLRPDDKESGSHRESGRGRGRGGRGQRGGRGGRYNDRSDRRRDRSRSRDREDRRDWNDRRDRFQKSRDFKGKGDRRGRDRDENGKEEKRRSPVEVDSRGVPVVKDSRTEEEKGNANKRKADDERREEAPKKSKIIIKEDE